jgi:hypothetical protein
MVVSMAQNSPLSAQKTEKSSNASFEKLTQDLKTIDASKPQNLKDFIAHSKGYLETVTFSLGPELDKEAEWAVQFASELMSMFSVRKVPPIKDVVGMVAEVYRAIFAKMDSQIEENYQPKSAQMDPSVWREVVRSGFGQDPDKTDNEELKKRYLKAKQEVRANILKNRQQMILSAHREVLLDSLQGWSGTLKQSNEQILDLFTEKGKSREILKTKLLKSDRHK